MEVQKERELGGESERGRKKMRRSYKEKERKHDGVRESGRKKMSVCV